MNEIDRNSRGPLLLSFFAILSALIVSVFLSHWSFCDGAPRNSLYSFMEGQAHRPFAYRSLVPMGIKIAEANLPETARNFLANRIAPHFHDSYIAPLLKRYEPTLPGLSERANSQWSNAHYRAAYVLMVSFIFASLFGTLCLLHHLAILNGASEGVAFLTVSIYGLVFPTIFLNGGYFYDFFEQFASFSLIYSVYKRKWLASILVLILMQLNKETAILMPLFLIPLVWKENKRLALQRFFFGLLLCLLLLILVRWNYAHLPGQPVEWHLFENLLFWSSPDPWLRTYDFYALGLNIPRPSFLLFSIFALWAGWHYGASEWAIAATGSFLLLAMLLLSMGYTDEYRNLSLSLPFLVLSLLPARKTGDKKSENRKTSE